MITDLFAGSNQNLGVSALLARINTGSKAANLKSENEDSSSMDFSAILSQTMDSGFTKVSDDNSFDNNESSTDSILSSFNASSLISSSFSVDSFDSSTLMNGSNSTFQKSFDVDNSVSDKKDTFVSKETKESVETNSTDKEVEKTDESKKAESSEEAKNSEETTVKEETQVEVAVEAEGLEAQVEISEEMVPTEEVATVKEAEAIEEVATIEEVETTEEVVVSKEASVEETGVAVAKTSEDEEVEAKAEEVESEEPTEEVEVATNEELAKFASEANVVNEQATNVETPKEAVEATTEESVENTDDKELTIKMVSRDGVKIDEEGSEEASETAEGLMETAEVAKAEEVEGNESQKEAKTESKSEKESKVDQLVKSLKEEETTLPTESLREEFARVTGQENQESENASDNGQMTQTNSEAQAIPAAATATTTAEEAAEKIFAALTGKSEGYMGKSAQGQEGIQGLEGSSRGSAMNQNSGSSNNSGFSFQSNSPQTYNSTGKVAQTHAPATTDFSEFLTKAEMVKTKDGAKVMNIEVEQEGLGKLEVELTSKDGEVTAKLSAQSEMAKLKIEELKPHIVENLIEKGVNLTQISVDVSSKDADKHGEEYQNSGKKNKSIRLDGVVKGSAKDIIEKNILPNLRRQALNIQSVDLKV